MGDGLHVPEGVVVLDMVCPVCGAGVPTLATIGSVLTSPSDDAPTLRPKLKAARIPHLCGQGTLFDRVDVGREADATR